MTPDQSAQLDALASFVFGYQRAGKTRRAFWDEFHALAGDLEALAFARDAGPDLKQRYFEILDGAHEGYGGPDEIMDEVM